MNEIFFNELKQYASENFTREICKLDKYIQDASVGNTDKDWHRLILKNSLHYIKNHLFSRPEAEANNFINFIYASRILTTHKTARDLLYEACRKDYEKRNFCNLICINSVITLISLTTMLPHNTPPIAEVADYFTEKIENEFENDPNFTKWDYIAYALIFNRNHLRQSKNDVKSKLIVALMKIKNRINEDEFFNELQLREFLLEEFQITKQDLNINIKYRMDEIIKNQPSYAL